MATPIKQLWLCARCSELRPCALPGVAGMIQFVPATPARPRATAARLHKADDLLTSTGSALEHCSRAKPVLGKVEILRPGVSSTEEKEPVALSPTLPPPWSWRRFSQREARSKALPGLCFRLPSARILHLVMQKAKPWQEHRRRKLSAMMASACGAPARVWLSA